MRNLYLQLLSKTFLIDFEQKNQFVFVTKNVSNKKGDFCDKDFDFGFT